MLRPRLFGKNNRLLRSRPCRTLPAPALPPLTLPAQMADRGETERGHIPV